MYVSKTSHNVCQIDGHKRSSGKSFQSTFFPRFVVFLTRKSEIETFHFQRERNGKCSKWKVKCYLSRRRRATTTAARRRQEPQERPAGPRTGLARRLSTRALSGSAIGTSSAATGCSSAGKRWTATSRTGSARRPGTRAADADDCSSDCEGNVKCSLC